MNWAQLNLFQNIQPGIPLVVKTSFKPTPSTSTLNDWQKSLALPVVILAAAFAGYTGGKMTSNRLGLTLEAYNVGLEWRFGEDEGYFTPLSDNGVTGYSVNF
jgi:hypothetical protein